MVWKLISGMNSMGLKMNMCWPNMALIMGYGHALLAYLASLFFGGLLPLLYSDC